MLVNPLESARVDAPQSAQISADAKPAAPARSVAAIDDAAREFEALFAAQMLKPMFEGISGDGLFGGGHAENTWRGFLLDALGKEIAASGGLGLADTVRTALLDAQGVTDAAETESR